MTQIIFCLLLSCSFIPSFGKIPMTGLREELRTDGRTDDERTDMGQHTIVILNYIFNFISRKTYAILLDMEGIGISDINQVK